MSNTPSLVGGYIYIYIYIYIFYPTPNVYHVVGVNGICGVFCIFCALGKAAEEGRLINFHCLFYLETGKTSWGGPLKI